jgi:predicted nucleic acid-binding protein
VGAVTGGHLLDTSFVIDYWQGRPDAVARLEALVAAGAPLLVNEVVICELFAGLRPAQHEDARRFLEPLEFIQPGPGAAATAGRWRAAARERGRVLHLGDALIAAAAEAVGAAVLTRNVRDFALAEVRVETY